VTGRWPSKPPATDAAEHPLMSHGEGSGQCLCIGLHFVLRRPIGRYGNIERNDRDAF